MYTYGLPTFFAFPLSIIVLLANAYSAIKMQSLWYFFILGVAILIIISGFISIMVLKRMRLESLGVRMVDLLKSLTTQGGLRAIDATKIKRINLSRGILFVALGGIILFGSNSIYIFEETRILGDLYWPSTFFAFFLFIRGRRYFQVDANYVSCGRQA